QHLALRSSERGRRGGVVRGAAAVGEDGDRRAHRGSVAPPCRLAVAVGSGDGVGWQVHHVAVYGGRHRSRLRPLHPRWRGAIGVEDVLARRTRISIEDRSRGLDCAVDVAALLAAELGRDQTWQDAELADYRTRIEARRAAEGSMATSIAASA